MISDKNLEECDPSTSLCSVSG